MVEKECNLRAGVFKVQTFGTTQSSLKTSMQIIRLSILFLIIKCKVKRRPRTHAASVGASKALPHEIRGKLI